ncbi:kinase-like protein [Colletotrichum eremochloae]|nr:kinase-like protein [Colletotrichum eremochloae]
MGRSGWCDPASPTTTISIHGADIKRRTAELVRTTGCFLSARQDSGRSVDIASSISHDHQASATYPGDDRIDGHLSENRGDENADEERSTLISDLEDDIEIIEDRGDSLRVAQLPWESHVPEAIKSGHEDLRSALLNARVKSSEGKNFIPTPTVERLLTEERVRGELGKSVPDTPSQELDDIARKICCRPGSDGAPYSPGFRRVFATLILMSRPADICSFIQSGISDDDLPLSESRLQQPWDHENSQEKAPLAVNWDQKLREQFQSIQWELSLPFFSKSNTASKVRFYRLDKNAVLPFTTEESDVSTQITAGGFSEVHKVKIHNACHDFTVPNGTFAVKTLQSDNESHFAEELKALQRFSHGNRRHIVAPLATFQRGDTYNIIFEWADRGDLRQFWRANQPPRQLSPDFVRWIAQQFLGLTKALERIHNFTPGEFDTDKFSTTDYGRHGDLKPDNILWFNDFDSPNVRGNLKIADFGLTKFSRSPGGQHRDQRHTPTYRAPEYDLNRGVTTQAYDIWSLGCLYLEFATWILTGSHGNATFTEARTMKTTKDPPDDSYFVVKRGDADGTLRAEIKPSVTQWIFELRQHPNCSPFLQRMLDIIENRMLVIDVRKRIKASDCASALDEAAFLIETDSPNQTKSLEPSTVTSEPDYGSRDEGTTVDYQLTTRLPRQNGTGSLRLEILDATSHRVSAFDRLRLRVERQFGRQFDWFPLPLVDRRPASARARLIWNYGGRDVSIFLNQQQLQRYRDRFHTCDPGILPTTNALPTSSSAEWVGPTRSNTFLTVCVSKALQCWQNINAAKCHNAVTRAPPSLMAGTQKESYFCIDEHWTRIRRTSMYTVPSVDLLEDDCQLFLTLRKSLTAAQGSWMYRLSSWRTCTGVQLSKFTFLFDDCDLVKAFEQGSNGNNHDICKGYDYCCLPDLDPPEQMQLMAETILQGIQEPEPGRNGRAVLDGIPKLQAPPGIHKKQYNSGWGFYTTQGYCLMKVLLWVGMTLSPGVVFAMAWLSSVNALDLQNAFVPISFLAGLFTIMLAAVMMCTT